MKTLWNKSELKNFPCDHCGKDLLILRQGNLVLKDTWVGDKMAISEIRWLCKSCDAGDPYRSWGWKDLEDLFIPDVLVQWIAGVLVGLHSGTEVLSDQAMEKLLKLLLIIFPHVSKKETAKQKRVLENLYSMPRCIGGLG